MFDNKQEVTENKEPRKGVAPFAVGIEMQDDNTIITKPIAFKDIGKVCILLHKAQPEDLEWDDLEYDEGKGYTTQQAFTIDLSGKITRGKVIDFYKKGYYQVRVDVLHHDYGPRPENTPYQVLKANIWLDNTEPIVSSNFEGGISKDIDERAYFSESITPPTESHPTVHENFMLPNNPEILQAVRLNIISHGK